MNKKDLNIFKCKQFFWIQCLKLWKTHCEWLRIYFCKIERAILLNTFLILNWIGSYMFTNSSSLTSLHWSLAKAHYGLWWELGSAQRFHLRIWFSQIWPKLFANYSRTLLLCRSLIVQKWLDLRRFRQFCMLADTGEKDCALNHTGLIWFRSFQNYAFKGWLSLETMKLWLFLVTKPLFLKTLIIKLTLGNIFIKVKNPPGGATVTK